MSEWLTAVLEEYKSLRAEAVAARDAQLAVLRFGVAITGALVALGVALRDEVSILSGVVLCWVVPGVIVFVVELWIGEIERTIRVGNFIAAIEDRLRQHFSDLGKAAPMAWETWLRREETGKRLSMSEHQWSSLARTAVIFALFVLFIAGSALAGRDFLETHGWDTESYAFPIVTLGAVVALGFRAGFVALRIYSESAPTAGDVWSQAKDVRPAAPKVDDSMSAATEPAV